MQTKQRDCSWRPKADSITTVPKTNEFPGRGSPLLRLIRAMGVAIPLGQQMAAQTQRGDVREGTF